MNKKITKKILIILSSILSIGVGAFSVIHAESVLKPETLYYDENDIQEIKLSSISSKQTIADQTLEGKVMQPYEGFNYFTNDFYTQSYAKDASKYFLDFEPTVYKLKDKSTSEAFIIVACKEIPSFYYYEQGYDLNQFSAAESGDHWLQWDPEKAGVGGTTYTTCLGPDEIAPYIQIYREPETFLLSENSGSSSQLIRVSAMNGQRNLPNMKIIMNTPNASFYYSNGDEKGYVYGHNKNLNLILNPGTDIFGINSFPIVTIKTMPNHMYGDLPNLSQQTLINMFAKSSVVPSNYISLSDNIMTDAEKASLPISIYNTSAQSSPLSRIQMNAILTPLRICLSNTGYVDLVRTYRTDSLRDSYLFGFSAGIQEASYVGMMSSANIIPGNPAYEDFSYGKTIKVSGDNAFRDTGIIRLYFPENYVYTDTSDLGTETEKLIAPFLSTSGTDTAATAVEYPTVDKTQTEGSLATQIIEKYEPYEQLIKQMRDYHMFEYSDDSNSALYKGQLSNTTSLIMLPYNQEYLGLFHGNNVEQIISYGNLNYIHPKALQECPRLKVFFCAGSSPRFTWPITEEGSSDGTEISAYDINNVLYNDNDTEDTQPHLTTYLSSTVNLNEPFYYVTKTENVNPADYGYETNDKGIYFDNTNGYCAYCIVGNTKYNYDKDFVVYGYVGSTLQYHCLKYNIIFKPIPRGIISDFNIDSAYYGGDSVIQGNKSYFNFNGGDIRVDVTNKIDIMSSILKDQEITDESFYQNDMGISISSTVIRYQFFSDPVQLTNLCNIQGTTFLPSYASKFTLRTVTPDGIISSTPLKLGTTALDNTSLSKIHRYLNSQVPKGGGLYYLACQGGLSGEYGDIIDIVIDVSQQYEIPIRIDNDKKDELVYLTQDLDKKLSSETYVKDYISVELLDEDKFTENDLLFNLYLIPYDPNNKTPITKSNIESRALDADFIEFVASEDEAGKGDLYIELQETAFDYSSLSLWYFPTNKSYPKYIGKITPTKSQIIVPNKNIVIKSDSISSTVGYGEISFIVSNDIEINEANTFIMDPTCAKDQEKTSYFEDDPDTFLEYTIVQDKNNTHKYTMKMNIDTDLFDDYLDENNPTLPAKVALIVNGTYITTANMSEATNPLELKVGEGSSLNKYSISSQFKSQWPSADISVPTGLSVILNPHDVEEIDKFCNLNKTNIEYGQYNSTSSSSSSFDRYTIMAYIYYCKADGSPASVSTLLNDCLDTLYKEETDSGLLTNTIGYNNEESLAGSYAYLINHLTGDKYQTLTNKTISIMYLRDYFYNKHNVLFEDDNANSQTFWFDFSGTDENVAYDSGKYKGEEEWTIYTGTGDVTVNSKRPMSNPLYVSSKIGNLNIEHVRDGSDSLITSLCMLTSNANKLNEDLINNYSSPYNYSQHPEYLYKTDSTGNITSEKIFPGFETSEFSLAENGYELKTIPEVNGVSDLKTNKKGTPITSINDASDTIINRLNNGEVVVLYSEYKRLAVLVVDYIGDEESGYNYLCINPSIYNFNRFDREQLVLSARMWLKPIGSGESIYSNYSLTDNSFSRYYTE